MAFRILKSEEEKLSWFESSDGLYLLEIKITNKYEDIFKKNSDKGFTGDGYDWCAVLTVLIDQLDLDLAKSVTFMPFTNEIFITSKDKQALKRVKNEFIKLSNNKNEFEYYLSHVDYI